MTTLNPYEPPKVDSLHFHPNQSGNNDVYRYGKKMLFVPKGCDLPPRCIRCNQTARFPLQKITLYVSQVYYSIAFFLIGASVLIILKMAIFIMFLLILAIIMEFLTQKKSITHYGICEDCHIQRKKQHFGWAFLFLICIASGFYVGHSNLPRAVSLTVLFFIVLAVFICLIRVSATGSKRLIKSTKIDKQGTYLTGFSKVFLQSFDYPTKKQP